MEATELRALLGVARKSWKIFLSYKAWFVSDILMGLFFVGNALLIGLGLTGKRNSEALAELTGYSDYLTFAVLGFMVLGFGITFLSGFVWAIVDELYAGTLEYSFAAPMRRITFFLGNVLVRLMVSLIYMAIYIPIFYFLFKLELNLIGLLKGIAVLLLGTVGMIGLGLMASGIVLYLKDPGPFINILEMLVFALSGAMYPIEILPRPLQFLASILPYAPTTSAVRSVVARGFISSIDKIAYMAMVSLVYAILGILAYRWSERKAREVGLKSY
ncbi:ABC transporter permease [Pyrococcus abyssi]|uniref:ABC transporter, ATP-binding protein, putative n=1 Tax=Pyrococcus abyssi (strain GE5 / Orsay) TaxID=272844 RepID=Q9V1K8_PYRAB|nr:ABC transporter permease [Pyrococcus abyssi]CAB49341.1 ABC type transporter permease component, substrate unknown [Pyrococcus abyssi GE5]CCE69799.1 TPA: ABC transporter, ATP-binding protein, putative [Pyrococcus abyssi GE5]